MSSIIQDFASGAALVEGLHAFLLKGHTLRPSYSGVGNGYCDDAIGTNASVHEVITLTFTSSTAFSVSGSVSGSMGTGSVGSLFNHARFTCTVVAGTTAWAAGDKIVWTMTAPWTALNYSSGQSYIYRAPGNDGNQEVNVGWTVKSNSTGGYFGIRIGAYPTILPGGGFWRQFTKCWLPLGSYAGSSLRLFAVASGECVWIGARIASYYMHALAGYAEIAGTLDAMPFPYLVGGAMSWVSEPADTSTSWAHASVNGGPLFPLTGISVGVEENVGAWMLYYRAPWNKWAPVQVGAMGLSTTNIETSAYRSYSPQFEPETLALNFDGSVPCFPYLIDRPANNDSTIGNNGDVVGKIPFVWRMPGYDSAGNQMIAESVFRSASRTKLVVLQTKNDSSPASLFALEMY